MGGVKGDKRPISDFAKTVVVLHLRTFGMELAANILMDAKIESMHWPGWIANDDLLDLGIAATEVAAKSEIVVWVDPQYNWLFDDEGPGAEACFERLSEQIAGAFAECGWPNDGVFLGMNETSP